MIAVNVKPMAPGRVANPNSVDWFFEDFFRPVTRTNSTNGGYVPAANVLKTETGINLEIAAPGYQKSDFSISLDEDRLTVSAKTEAKENGNVKYIKRDFVAAGFERVFRLPKTVDDAAINAVYDNGILRVNLPYKTDLVKSITVK
ncbi:MAG: Hsp20/alpha crystallin family protein [Lewinellaceae bacterium]|nr:Hsp20/alpha crystallin family protein [Lewinella sp.]MCB9278302.1 Hsp20/alpha crystallin family protein [Lewinellaceae bacterium]